MKSAKILTVLFLIAGCSTEATEATETTETTETTENNTGRLRVSWIIQNFICNGPLTIKLGNNQAEIVPCQVAGSHLFNPIDTGGYNLTVEYNNQTISRTVSISPYITQQENFIF